MTRDEAIALIHRLDVADGEEEELDDILHELIEAFPNGDIGNLLYHHKPHLTVEQVYDEAMIRVRRGAALFSLPYRPKPQD